MAWYEARPLDTDGTESSSTTRDCLGTWTGSSRRLDLTRWVDRRSPTSKRNSPRQLCWLPGSTLRLVNGARAAAEFRPLGIHSGARLRSEDETRLVSARRDLARWAFRLHLRPRREHSVDCPGGAPTPFRRRDGRGAAYGLSSADRPEHVSQRWANPGARAFGRPPRDRRKGTRGQAGGGSHPLQSDVPRGPLRGIHPLGSSDRGRPVAREGWTRHASWAFRPIPRWSHPPRPACPRTPASTGARASSSCLRSSQRRSPPRRRVLPPER